MSESKEFKKKLEKYGNMYEEEVQEMLILTGENLGGAYSLTRGIWITVGKFSCGCRHRERGDKQRGGRVILACRRKRQGRLDF